MHSCPVPHEAPQAPQFIGSLCRSTQLWPHGVSPGTVHSVPQVPAEQSCPAGQAAPQAPQLAPSLCRSTHAPAQSVRPAWQTHWLLTQLWPTTQAMLQAPQWDAFELRATQSVPHWVRPAGQAGAAVVPPSVPPEEEVPTPVAAPWPPPAPTPPVPPSESSLGEQPTAQHRAAIQRALCASLVAVMAEALRVPEFPKTGLLQRGGALNAPGIHWFYSRVPAA
jgi:hypothetical protein